MSCRLTIFRVYIGLYERFFFFVYVRHEPDTYRCHHHHLSYSLPLKNIVFVVAVAAIFIIFQAKAFRDIKYKNGEKYMHIGINLIPIEKKSEWKKIILCKLFSLCVLNRCYYLYYFIFVTREYFFIRFVDRMNEGKYSRIFFRS